MSAEDYDDVPNFGGEGFNYSPQPKRQYACNFCKQPITFNQRKAYNKDGTPHRCQRGKPAEEQPQEPQTQATLFAMAAMNAIINASIQSAGVDYIHSMNFYDVADASWRVASAMVAKEKAYSDEFRKGE